MAAWAKRQRHGKGGMASRQHRPETAPKISPVESNLSTFRRKRRSMAFLDEDRRRVAHGIARVLSPGCEVQPSYLRAMFGSCPLVCDVGNLCLALEAHLPPRTLALTALPATLCHIALGLYPTCATLR